MKLKVTNLQSICYRVRKSSHANHGTVEVVGGDKKGGTLACADAGARDLVLYRFTSRYNQPHSSSLHRLRQRLDIHMCWYSLRDLIYHTACVSIRRV